MAWQLFAKLGMDMLGGFMQYQSDKAEAKAARAYQKYRNTMTNLSNAINQNAITTNEIMSNDAFTREAVDIKKDYLAADANATVSAAAAGVKGRSVNQSLFDIKRSMDVAEGLRQENLRNSWLAFDQQRQTSAMDAALQQDHSYIPKPKLASYLLNAASKNVTNFM